MFKIGLEKLNKTDPIVDEQGVSGEIFIPKSLKTNMAIESMKQKKNLDKVKFTDSIIKIWMETGNNGFTYYRCAIEFP